MIPSISNWLERLPSRGRPVLKTCLYGLVAGLAAVLFQIAITGFYRITLLELSRSSTVAFLAGSFVVMMTTSLLVGFLLNRFCTEAAGSGIPQLKLAFWKDFGAVPLRVVWVKFVAGVLSIGGGSSLGREGPSVQLSGALASNLAGALGEAKQNRRLAAAAGAAGGLAAAFNTPLAAVTFVLEEIIADLNSRLLGGVLLASVIGAFVVHGLVGKQPAFILPSVDSPTWVVYCITPLVAAAGAVAGALFQRGSLGLRLRNKQPGSMPAWMKPAAGALITWLLGSAVFVWTGHLGVFGLGYEDLSAGIAGELTWKIAVILLGAKLIATVACYGFGGCGGIFSPTLFFGGMCGIVIGGLAGMGTHLSPADQVTLAVVGMSACLGAVVRAPVTGILIVFEMTHEFALVPALMIGALVSQAIAHRMNRHNFYEEVLLQDGHHLDHVIPPRDLQSWHQLPVSAVANFQPVVTEKLDGDTLRTLLSQHPYQRFPVEADGGLSGILTRKEAELALKLNRLPVLEKAVTCLRTDTIKRLQQKIIESSTLMVVILDKPEGRPVGLVTLHDLLRAEMAAAEESLDPDGSGKRE